MPIRYNPRLILKRTHFHALSCAQLCDYLKSMNYTLEKSEDKTKVENAWWDIHDSLYNRHIQHPFYKALTFVVYTLLLFSLVPPQKNRLFILQIM